MKKYFLLFLAITLTSCGLKPIVSEYSLLRTFSEPILIDNFDSGKIMIYNGAGFLHKIDNTTSINVWIDDKPLGQIQANEYVLLYLFPGKYEVKLEHRDSFKFASTHTIEINHDTKVIEVKPTLVSNKVNITNRIPQDFERFRNVLN